MGRKNVIFCDLCKQEAEEDSLSQLTFKKPNKKTANKYEICASCAEKLQVQLVSESELLEGWEFGITAETSVVEQSPPSEKTTVERPQEPASEDDAFVASKLEEVSQRPKPEIKVAKSKGGKCLHYNRTSPVMGTVGGEKAFVQKCKSCGHTLPLQTAEERHAISNGE